MLSLTESVAVGSAVASGVVWLAVLHARISLSRRDAADATRSLAAHEQLCGERYATIGLQHEETRRWMERLEGKIDVLMVKD